jgi:hypothetical protein
MTEANTDHRHAVQPNRVFTAFLDFNRLLQTCELAYMAEASLLTQVFTNTSSVRVGK